MRTKKDDIDIRVSLAPKNRLNSEIRSVVNLAQQALPSPQEVTAALHRTSRVTLNVGGERHEVMWRNLQRLPNTRLGRLQRCQSHEDVLQLCDDYCLLEGEFFFDRYPRAFLLILNFYRTGKLHLVEEICVMGLATELNYWGISEDYFDLCCQHRFHQKKECAQEEIRKDDEAVKWNQRDKEVNFGIGRYAGTKRFMWNILEEPQTSSTARVSSFCAQHVLQKCVCVCVCARAREQCVHTGIAMN